MSEQKDQSKGSAAASAKDAAEKKTDAPKDGQESKQPAAEEALDRSAYAMDLVVVHPLVLLSIVDHYTRVAKDTNKRVVGVLLGEKCQTDRQRRHRRGRAVQRQAPLCASLAMLLTASCALVLFFLAFPLLPPLLLVSLFPVPQTKERRT